MAEMAHTRRMAICPACRWLIRVDGGRLAEHSILDPHAGGQWVRVCAGSGTEIR